MRRSPGDGTLFKRADGLWIGGVELPTTDGKRRQKRVSAKSRNECIRKMRELRAAIDAGVIAGTGAVKMTVYLTDWLDKVHRLRAKPATYTGDVGVVRLHLLPAIGGKRLDRLTAHDIATTLGGIQDTGKTRTAQRAHQLLGRALDDAVKRGMIARNPATAVDKPRHVTKRHDPFTPPQTLHIIRTAEATRDEMWAARWATGFMTGCRESEVLGLEWDRVDLDNNLLDVSWQLQELQKSHGCGDPVDGAWPCGKKKPSFCPHARWNFPPGFEHRTCERSLVWTRPKSQRSDRGVPIISPLHDILARLRDRTPNPHNLVFHHPDGTPITQSQDQKAWRALLVAADVPHVPQHTIRRTAASLLRAAQVDEQTRQELFGHASSQVQRIYAAADLEMHRAAMGKLADILELDT